jgi:uncharacterized membrane protein YheB (UPF0754 family)
MHWEWITGPMIGAVIGYVTNKIAVDMLFRPLKPIYIGKFHVPFTPGIIPKGKDRLGKAIGNVVGNNLLTPAIIKQTLLSEDMLKDIEEQIDKTFEKLSSEDCSIETKMVTLLGEDSSLKLETGIVQGLTEKISSGLSNMNLGEIIATEVMAAVQEKLHGTLVSMFVKPSTLAPIEAEIKNRVELYIAEHGEEKIGDYIKEEYTNLKEHSVSALTQKINPTELKKVILNFYRIFVDSYAEKFLASINLSKIVEDKVSAMDTKEVEKLVLAIMEKELGAVVNLGAVIGLLLGIANIFF